MELIFPIEDRNITLVEIPISTNHGPVDSE